MIPMAQQYEICPVGTLRQDTVPIRSAPPITISVPPLSLSSPDCSAASRRACQVGKCA